MLRKILYRVLPVACCLAVAMVSLPVGALPLEADSAESASEGAEIIISDVAAPDMVAPDDEQSDDEKPADERPNEDQEAPTEGEAGPTASSDDGADETTDEPLASNDEGDGSVYMENPRHMWNAPQSGIALFSASSPTWKTVGGTKSFYDGDGKLYASPALKVIDVSEWQGNIDWASVKNSDVDAVILRAGYGAGNLDKQFARNIQQVKKYGIPYGLYLYSYAYDASFAEEEAAWMVEILDKYDCDDMSLPIYYDIEQFSPWKDGSVTRNPPSSVSAYQKVISTFVDYLAAHGYENVNVYTYRAYLQSRLNSSDIWAITSWIAEYNPTLAINNTYYQGQYGWQYTDSGSVPGISGGVDTSAFSDWDYLNVSHMSAVEIPDGTYYLNSHLLDSSGIQISGGSTASGATTVLSAATGSASQRFTFARQSDGSYVIKNEASGLVLDVSGANAYNGAKVQQYAENGSAAQRWFLRDSGAGYYLQSALGNYVLDVASAQTADGTSIRLYAPNGTNAQLFMPAAAESDVPVEKTVAIRSAIDDAMVVDVKSGSSANDTPVQLYTWNDTDAQLFTLRSVGNGIYEIVNVKTGKLVEVTDGRTTNSAKVGQYEKNGSLSQHWSIRSQDDGSFVLISCKSGKVLDVSGGTVANGKQLQIYTPNRTAAQRWFLTGQESQRARMDAFAKKHKGTIKSGVYALGSASSERQVIDVKNGSSANGANVQIYASNGTDAQRWNISEDGVGYLTITNVGSGKALDVKNGSTSNKANVQQYASNGSYAQKWVAVRNSDGTITLYSALKTNLVLDMYGNKTANGTNVDVYAANGTTAQKFKLYSASPVTKSDRFVNDGTYTISAQNGRVLDVPSGKKTDGVQLQTYAANGTASQAFYLEYNTSKGLYSIRSVVSGRVLDAAEGDFVAATPVNQWGTSAGNASQRYWALQRASNGGYLIVNASTGQALGCTSSNKLITVPTSDSRVVVWKFGGSSILWSQQELDEKAASQGAVLKNGTYAIASAANQRMVVDVKNGSKQNSANVQLYTTNETNAQRWRVENLSSGYVRVVNVGSGKVLDVKSASKSSGANVQQYASNGTRAQMWLPVKQSDGSYVLYSALGNGLVLDVNGGSMKNGANMQIYAYNGTNAQRFMFKQ